jgi:hypothetical protein
MALKAMILKVVREAPREQDFPYNKYLKKTKWGVKKSHHINVDGVNRKKVVQIFHFDK